MFDFSCWLFILSVFISSCAQVILKTSANIKQENIIKEYLNYRVIAGYSILLLATFLTIIAYRQVDFKNGIMLDSMGYVFVLFLSYIFLHERLSISKILGVIIILCGIYIAY